MGGEFLASLLGVYSRGPGSRAPDGGTGTCEPRDHAPRTSNFKHREFIRVRVVLDAQVSLDRLIGFRCRPDSALLGSKTLGNGIARFVQIPDPNGDSQVGAEPAETNTE